MFTTVRRECVYKLVNKTLCKCIMWRNDYSKWHQPKKKICLTQEILIFTVQRHNSRQYELNANPLQSSYARQYHSAVPQAMSRNTNFLLPVSDDKPECYYKHIDKGCISKLPFTGRDWTVWHTLPVHRNQFH